VKPKPQVKPKEVVQSEKIKIEGEEKPPVEAITSILKPSAPREKVYPETAQALTSSNSF